MARPRVLVVGSGLAGLTSAYLLRKEGCEVWLIEKSDRLGFHSWSVDIPVVRTGGTSAPAKKQKWVVDVPMRSFQGGYYPLLISLYRHLGIPLLPTCFTFSFSRLQNRSIRTYFIYSGNNGFSRPSFPFTSSVFTLFRSTLTFLRFSISFLVLVILAFLSWHRLLPSLLGHHRTLDTLRQRGGGWGEFVLDIVVPIFASVGTMTQQQLLRTPLPAILDYVHSTMGTVHYALAEGYSAATIAEHLARPVRNQGEGHVRLGATITGMDAGRDGVSVTMEDGDEFTVDKVVIATQASSAKTLLKMLSPGLDQSEKKRTDTMLGALDQVNYCETIIVTHRDRSVLPCQADVRDINFVTPSSPSSHKSHIPSVTLQLDKDTELSEKEPPTTPHFSLSSDRTYTMATQAIPPPKAYAGQEPVFQTTNPIVPVDPASVIGTARLERALPAQDPTVFDRLHPAGNGIVHLAGSYAYPGIPLLEGCVGSARRAAAAVLGEKLEDIGGMDWNAGRGGVIGRLWRYRRSGVVI